MVLLTKEQLTEFFNSILDMKRYSAVIRKEDNTKYPSVVLSFNTPENAQLFLKRILQMSHANRYEATIYVEDTVPEIYAALDTPKDKPKEAVE